MNNPPEPVRLLSSSVAVPDAAKETLSVHITRYRNAEHRLADYLMGLQHGRGVTGD